VTGTSRTLFVALFILLGKSLAIADDSSYAASIKGVACFRVPNAWPALAPDDLRKQEEQIRNAAAPKVLDEQLLFYATGRDLPSGAWGVVLLRRYPNLGISQESVRATSEALVEQGFRKDIEGDGRTVRWIGTRQIPVGEFSAYRLEYGSQLRTGHSTRNVRILIPNGARSFELMITVTAGNNGYPLHLVRKVVESLAPC
jgi:hypothetical protein